MGAIISGRQAADDHGRPTPRYLRRMGRVIAIDHGAKRTGLAVTDPLRIIATALATVPTPEVLDHLKQYVAGEQVDGFVVGLPVNLDGTPTDATAQVQAFIAQLRRTFPDKWVETADERFTSRMAQQVLLQSGKGRMARRDKGQLDRISATIILQGWLAR
jgi:putative Holliday junction resolvase